MGMLKFLVIGLILLTSGSVTFQGIKKKKWGCAVPSAFLFLTLGWASIQGTFHERVNLWMDRHREKQSAQQVDAFLEEVSPDLYEKLEVVRGQLEAVEEKIAKLRDLIQRFPEQRTEITNALNEWDEVHKGLKTAYEKIDRTVKDSYVRWTIDELQGRQSLESVRRELMDEANEALGMVTTLRAELEEEDEDISIEDLVREQP